MLKDPYSAKFGAIRATENKRQQLFFACGLLNAKNSFGAYTGDAPFVLSWFITSDGEPRVRSADIANADNVEDVIRSCTLYVTIWLDK